jgi:hypothetical protein
MSDLLSKVSASGLSAGVFLLWWPAHVTSQGSEALLARGILWALAFEVLLLGFRPLERAVGRAVRTRDTAAIAPRRIAPVLALATVAAVVPVTMLCGQRAPLAAPAKAAAAKVIVKREIVRREVVVRRVNHVVRVPVPVAATTTAPVAAPVRATPAKAATTTTPKKTTATAKSTSTSTAADTKADLSASPVTTTTAPAATPTTTQPTTTATPAATAATTKTAATPPAAATTSSAG